MESLSVISRAPSVLKACSVIVVISTSIASAAFAACVQNKRSW
jgi:hypothetical protein